MRSNPDFQKIFSAARSRTLDLAMLRGLRKCENMVDVLVDVATGEPKSNCVAKVTAASTLLDFMLRIAKLEQIQESIARLEQDRANGYVVAPHEAPFESPALPTTAKDESEPIQ